MIHYSACIELLFKQEGDEIADRIHRAKQAGFDTVEFWGWMKKDVPEIKRALDETGVKLAAIVAEPMVWLTDPENHEAFLMGLAQSAATAKQLGAPVMIAQAGNMREGVSRQEQHEAIVQCLTKAADILAGTGVTLALEPLNDRVDHPGYFLTSTREGLDIVDEVNRPEIRLLYDLYHSFVMDEDIAEVLEGRVDRIVHAHLADHPGRNEPGTGRMDWQAWVAWLKDNGYDGLMGLEYRPTGAPVTAYPSGTAN